MHDQENISKVVQNMQSNQLKGMAGPAGAAAVAGAFVLRDRMRQQDAQNAAMLNQQQIMNKQLFIQNKLLEGWSMQDIDEEIAAGEANMRQWDAEAQAAAAVENDMGNGIVLGIVVAIALSVVLSVVTGGMASGPQALIIFGIPITLLVLWIRNLSKNYSRALKNGA